MNPAETESATTDEIRQLEARVDARLQAVNARFIAVDGRFARLGHRIDDVDQQGQMLDRRSSVRCKSIDESIDSARTQLDRLDVLVNAQVDQMRRDLTRVVLLGLLGAVASTAMVCLATILLIA